MNSKELRALQEAYIQVYELDEEAPKRIKKPSKNPRLMNDAGPARVYNPSPKKVEEEVDLYDIILSHLLDEGYADTEEAATAIMVNMSEEWRQSIVEDIAGNQYTPNPIGNAIKTGAGLIKKVLGNSSSSGTSTKPGDGKPYQDGPLWDGPKTPTKPTSQKGPANRDEPLW